MALKDTWKDKINEVFEEIKNVDLSDEVDSAENMLHQFTQGISEKYFNKKHVLVIGGAGYVGNVLVRSLLTRGYKVRVLDCFLYDNRTSILSFLNDSNFSFVYGDFGDTQVLNEALEGITDVVLLAALVGDPICKKYPDLAKKVNLDHPKKLLEQLNRKHISTFVFTSTCSNYGLISDDILADEHTALNPQSLYAETKVAFEKYVLENLYSVDYSPVILRISTAFGLSGRMRFDLTVSEFSKELALGNELLVYDENTWRPYCHVRDIADAIITVLSANKKQIRGEVFNIGSTQENYTKKMIVDSIKEYIPDAKVQYKKGGFDPRNYRVSFEKIKNKLHFEPKASVKQSIKAVIDAVHKKLFVDVNDRKDLYGNYSIEMADEK